VVLSFVLPGADAALEQRLGARFVSGRALVDEVRPRARTEYLQLIARLGATPCLSGRTLRQLLTGPGNYSRWWFLDVTEKDCLWEGDRIYLTVLHLMAIQAAKEKYSIGRLRLVGAAPELAAALRQRGARRPFVVDLARAILLGLSGRLLLLVEYLRTWADLQRLPLPAEDSRDVLLQAYWDWTVHPDGEGGLRDRYFTTLPAQLAFRGLTVGWLASCEPSAEAWQKGRRRRDVLRMASEHPDVTLIERHLTLGDIAGTVSNLQYPVQVTRAIAGRAFGELSAVAGFDLHPLVRRQILNCVWGRTFCRLQLVATGIARACTRRRPCVVLGAFDLFLRSRALYAGARAAVPRPRVWAALHAVYSRDKTFGVLEPSELRGVPDGSPIPAPDGVFGLGELSRRIWEGNGFDAEQVVLTGGLRYQGITAQPRRGRATTTHVSVLLAGGLGTAAHVDLCDAAIAATSGLPVRLYFRDHPVHNFTNLAAFRPFREWITVTAGTLDDDLRAADLVLFSQSGIAEEAFLRGVPTWQWLWAGCNTSAFVDVRVIPAFTSVAALRRALEAFTRDPASYQPTAETQRRVLHECYGIDPAGAAVRIAEALRRMVRPAPRAILAGSGAVQ
jgi:surface carbohydrate biosynthesis protein (TIGR04326 family)